MNHRLLFLSRGMQAMVSHDDYASVAAFSWTFCPRAEKTGYAYRRGPAVRGSPRKKIYLHRQIVQPPGDFLVDHINGNGLDCRRENLRLATFHQNAANCAPVGFCPYRGVSVFRGRYVARIFPQGTSVYLGSFGSMIEAARAYDRAAIKHYGPFAFTNLPRADYSDTATDALSHTQLEYEVPF